MSCLTILSWFSRLHVRFRPLQTESLRLSGSGDNASFSPDDFAAGLVRFLGEPPIEGSVRELVSGPEALAAGIPVG